MGSNMIDFEFVKHFVYIFKVMIFFGIEIKCKN